VPQEQKIERLIREYGLDGLGDELERLWTADTDERMSLRELADHVNRRLLREALDRAGVQPVDGELENMYRLLTGEEATEGERLRIRRRLERQDVDVESLLSDFVSYQAVRTYLTEIRGAVYTRNDSKRVESDLEHVQQLRSRTEAVTTSKLERLWSAGSLSIDDFRVIVDVSVLCEGCGVRHDIAELLEEGSCECQ